MLLVNKKPLDPNDEQNKFTQEYLQGLSEIRKEFEGRRFIMLKQKDHPVRDNEGNLYPVPPVVIPLRTFISSPDGTGRNEWAYCDGMPILQPNGLYEITKKSHIIGRSLVIDLERDIDMAFYILKKSKAFRNKLIVVDDPGIEARKRGQEKREKLLVEAIIWQELNNDEELRLIASAWGVEGAYDGEADLVREKLENELHRREKLRKNDASVKGINAFVDSIKDKTKLRTQSFLQRSIDGGMLRYEKENRRYMIGDSEILVVPIREQDRPFAFLCDYFNKHEDKLHKVVEQLMTEPMITSASFHELKWLARIAGVVASGKKTEELRQDVKDAFCT